jgi:hypothetical protein
VNIKEGIKRSAIVGSLTWVIVITVAWFSAPNGKRPFDVAKFDQQYKRQVDTLSKCSDSLLLSCDIADISAETSSSFTDLEIAEEINRIEARNRENEALEARLLNLSKFLNGTQEDSTKKSTPQDGAHLPDDHSQAIINLSTRKVIQRKANQLRCDAQRSDRVSYCERKERGRRDEAQANKNSVQQRNRHYRRLIIAGPAFVLLSWFVGLWLTAGFLKKD